ncbi:hypothetical protein A1O3_06589 [Capronia epimyces CBS 606.96]|uniref:Pathogenesis associated protein Cap20 n=1 Tax=Capronia epimyces CBS 606.96 TaxID=1182542 RepID=W9YKI7_9EURO|nr:uncharacterized protein A1O3_06589 [Capronia epimyces CBS 606.96]EXJ82774.1 hypothetical protein A1O3_06589 [Capronia epimyces CBS 606.96]
MGEATVNGDLPHSAFFSHLSSYPLVSDSVKTIKGNPYGAKSIDLTNAGYAKFVKPAVPYLETPASYAKPYVAKADELGDKLLSKIDEQVPIVKSETKDIQSKLHGYINWPLETANNTKDWAFKTYGDEYKKCGGDGVVAGGKAVITTSLVLSSDVLKWVSSFLQAKKEEAKEIAQEKTNK